MSCTLMRDQEEPKQNLLSFLWMNSRYALFSVFALVVAVVVQAMDLGLAVLGSNPSSVSFSLGSLLSSRDSISSAIK